VTTFDPTNKGMVQDQLAVPLAVPAPPVFVDQITCATPTLSLAVPLKTMLAALVEIDVAPGVAIVNVGAVVSVPPLLGGTAGKDWRVMVTLWDTLLDPAVAVTVKVFVPMASAIFGMVHVVIPDATPDDVEEDQVTEVAPDPPVAVPERLTVEDVVVAVTGFTASVSGPGAGVGVGGGVDAPCAA
jgi:hypothetical protein